MEKLVSGQRMQLPNDVVAKILEVEVQLQSPLTIDITCFGLDGQMILADDKYMIFYNQKESPGKEIRLRESDNQKGIFLLELSRMPASIQNIVFTATIDGSGTMSQLSTGHIAFKDNGQTIAQYDIVGQDFSKEKAIIISEVYYKNNWRINAVGKGFDGGLSALLKHFGGKETAEQSFQPVPEKIVSLKKLELEKKMEKQAPKILDLAKKVKISLEKVGLQNHDAKVALCLDISASMGSLYSSGKIQAFAERILALGTRFADNGSIDIFLFGQGPHEAGELTIDNSNGFVNRMLRNFPLEGATYYGKVMKIIRQHYFGQAVARSTPLSQALPVYVMFVTDGATFDESETRAQIDNSSYEPIFWQFMAIGKSKKDAKNPSGFFGALKAAFQSDFTFLEGLDTMEGRFIDNANFFSVEDPANIADESLYELLMAEYPEWVKKAKQQGLLK